VREYQDAYSNKLPSYYSENCYTAARWLVAALEKLNGDVSDREKVLKAVRGVSLSDTPRGPVKLDKYDNPVQNIYVRKVQTVNGKLMNVPVFTYTNVSQFWKYTAEDFLKQPVFSKTYPPIT
jgi:branched-chain amino acid transport system substrate-binding protein